MKLVFWPTAWADYLHWQQTGPRGLAKLNALISECSRSPFKGLGKPEPLGGNLSGWWSRRITQEHQLIYRATGSGAAKGSAG